jgi:hypothetical protein
MLGHAFSVVYGADQLTAVVSYGPAGPLLAPAGPRAAFLVAGAGALGVLIPALRAGYRGFRPGARAALTPCPGYRATLSEGAAL